MSTQDTNCLGYHGEERRAIPGCQCATYRKREHKTTQATKEDAQEIFGGKSRIEVGARRWLKRDPFFGNNRHAYCEMYVVDLCDEIDRLRAIEKRAHTLYDYAREKGGMGDEVTDCQYILEDRGLWKNVLP